MDRAGRLRASSGAAEHFKCGLCGALVWRIETGREDGFVCNREIGCCVLQAGSSDHEYSPRIFEIGKGFRICRLAEGERRHGRINMKSGRKAYFIQGYVPSDGIMMRRESRFCCTEAVFFSIIKK